MTASSNSRLPVQVDDIPGPDFTIYSKGSPAGVTGRSYDGSFSIFRKGVPGNQAGETARGLTCPAYGGAYWSTTLRCDAPNQRLQRLDYFDALERKLTEYGKTLQLAKFKARDFLGYCPKGYAEYEKSLAAPPAVAVGATTGTAVAASGVAAPGGGAGEIFLNDIHPICREFYEVLDLDPVSSPCGVIAITGATNSSKSLIARGLIFLILEAAAKHALENRIRKPHLVTLEDPIEEYFIKNSKTHLVPDKLEDLTALLDALNVDYTPRQKGTDTDNLTSVIKDAKRQTPAVLFVGETRDAKDWTELLDFGSSGHLVVTTAHSGSAVEAMSQILRSTDAETASQRSEVARRIRGIVNIRSFTQMVKNEDGTSASLRTLLPAIWKSTPPSINNLVADGLSSILPALGREEEIGYYGRTHFARSLIPVASERFKRVAQSEKLEQDIKRKAMEWDIRGI